MAVTHRNHPDTPSNASRAEPCYPGNSVLKDRSRLVLDELAAKYQRGAGKWSGCDWPTDFGPSHLDLAELKASQALLLARATGGKEAADWQLASRWLSRIEQEAQEAEVEAGIALALASTGQFREALGHARHAFALETRYHSKPVWQPFCQALETVLALQAENSPHNHPAPIQPDEGLMLT